MWYEKECSNTEVTDLTQSHNPLIIVTETPPWHSCCFSDICSNYLSVNKSRPFSRSMRPSWWISRHLGTAYRLWGIRQKPARWEVLGSDSNHTLHYRGTEFCCWLIFSPTFNKPEKNCKENTSSVIILGKNSNLLVASTKMCAKRNFQ